MNNRISTYLFLITVPFVFGCRGTLKEENKPNALTSNISSETGTKKYGIDTKQSVITWKGGNSIGTNTHKGFIYISKGELTIANGQLIGGTVEVDMNTIEEEDHSRDNGLVNHLKDPDFFDVKKFPFSTILLNKAESKNSEINNFSGNLTIKNITQPVTFPAKISVMDGFVKMEARLVIDRTKWDIRYKSGKFYDLLADQTISDSIEFNITIIAK